MPTGYTACMLEGADFETFAMVGMRAFSAAAHMRDEPVSKPYEPRRPSEYYADRLKEAQAKLVELESLSLDDRLVHAVQDYNKKCAFFQEHIDRRRANNMKLDAMLAQVEAFCPPTPDHANFKRFMICSIKESASDGDATYFERELKKLKKPKTIADAEEWYREQHGRVVQEVASRSADLTKDLQVCKEVNEWAKQAIVAIEQTKKTLELEAENPGRSP